MRKNNWRSMIFACALAAFFCLLLSGGSRLIASPESAPAAQPMPKGLISASLTCAPAPVQGGESVVRAQEKRSAPAETALAVRRADGIKPPVTDANGNILRCASYMHAVYQAFALDDGFA